MSQYQQWLGRKREHSYHKVPITCSTGRGLSKVSAAVTGGRRLLRCLVHLDRLDRDLLSHGATWGEKGAFSLSVLIPLWPCTAPHTACHTAGTQGPRRGQVACRALEGKRKCHSSFCPTSRYSSGMSVAFITIPGSTRTQHRRCWEERAPAQPIAQAAPQSQAHGVNQNSKSPPSSRVFTLQSLASFSTGHSGTATPKTLQCLAQEQEHSCPSMQPRAAQAQPHSLWASLLTTRLSAWLCRQ